MLRLLGPPELRGVGGPLLFARRKSLALLAYLALEKGVHARDSLAALFWPECDQARARGNLRSSLFELGRSLGDGALDLIQDRIGLVCGRLRLDVDDLQAGVRPCAHGPDGVLCPPCLVRLEAAVGATRGPFMAGFSLTDCPDFDDWQFRWSTRLKEIYAPLLRRLIAAYRVEGRVDEAARIAERWIETEPYAEEARRTQIELLLHLGLASRARDCYEAWTETAGKELGRLPAASTRALLEGCARGSSAPASPRREAALSRSETGSPPVRLPDLLGREGDLAILAKALREPTPRLHCLTGPGGIGKTTLALALVEAEGKAFTGGAFFIDLSAEREIDRLPFRVAAALGMREIGEGPEAMTALLAARIGAAKTLLVADNLEQLPGSGEWLSSLLGFCARLVILATSRRELHVPGERVHSIEPLRFPPPAACLAIDDVAAWPALELFLRGTRRVNPAFRAEADTLAVCARLCARLDGIPLALELGSAHMALFGPEELLRRLERHFDIAMADGRAPAVGRGIVDGRVREFEVPRQAAADRHRSLGAVLDWSHELLSPYLRLLYAGLAVFVGDFDAEAAEAILGDAPGPQGEAAEEKPSVLKGLELLVEASLLRRNTEGARARFSYFQTIRDHAEERLEELASKEGLRDRCAEFYLERAEQTSAGLRGPEQVTVLHLLGAELGNFEASVERFARRGRIEEAYRLCRALEWAWFRSGRFAFGIAALEFALSRDAGAEASSEGLAGLRGACLRALGWLRFTQGSWHEAHARYLEALSLLEPFGKAAETARCLADLGVVERWLGNQSGGNLRSAGAIELARGLGDPGLLALTLVWGHGTTGGKPGSDEQLEGLEEAIRLARLADDPWILAHAHESLGDLLRERGSPTEALPHFERALKDFTRLEDGWMVAWTLEGYGMNDAAEGAFERGRARLEDALGRFVLLGARSDAAFVLGELGLVASMAGDREAADFRLGAFASISGELGIRTLAISFDSIGAPEGRTTVRATLAECASRNSPQWRRGLSMGYEDLSSIVPD